MVHPVSDALTETDYTRFRSLILRRTGLDFPPARRRDLSTGLYYVLRQADSKAPASLDALYGVLLDGDNTLWETV
ncbi:MAG: hypothetical protein JW910_16485, partial [Anaerolineae bacterium]|nr:hypothetical protein [Anaerolineae bacterium]